MGNRNWALDTRMGNPARHSRELPRCVSAMIIYLAARYSRQAELRGYADQIHAQTGHKIEARWLNGNHELAPGTPRRQGVEFALEDYEDVRSADLVIVFTEDPDKPKAGRARGGYHVEYGLALAWQKPVWIVGHRENVFHWLDWPRIEFFPEWESALDLLKDREVSGWGPLP